MTILDTMGLIMIVPFFQYLTGSVGEISLYIISVIEGMGFQDYQRVWGCIIVLSLGVGVIFKSLSYYYIISITQNIRDQITRQQMYYVLNLDWIKFREKDNDGYLKNIFSETDQIILGVIQPLLNIISNITIISITVIAISFVSMTVSFLTTIIFTILYGLIYIVSHARLRQTGLTRSRANSERFSAAQMLLERYEEIHLTSTAENYIENFEKSSNEYCNSLARSMIRGQIPRYIVEFVAFGFLIMLSLLLLWWGQSGTQVFSTVLILAVAGYRLFPAFQAVYNALTQLVFTWPALENLNLAKSINLELQKKSMASELRNVRFKHDAVKNFGPYTFKLPRTGIVSICGPSGSGKTTLVMGLMGFVPPQSGRILKRSDTCRVSYCKQLASSFDVSIEDYLKHGLPSTGLQPSKISKLMDRLSLKSVYEQRASVNQNLLSGGERQRLELARQVLKSTEVLILDEPTSALDADNANSIVELLLELSEEILIIVISHDMTFIEKLKPTFEIEM